MAKISTKSWPKKSWEKPAPRPEYVEKSFTPSPMQQDFFSWVQEGSGSAILEAVAGSGKTTTLIHATKLMKGSVFFGAFNKAIAEEIAHKTASNPLVTASTLHSAGYSIWKSHVGKCKVDSWKVTNIFRELFTEEKEQEFLYAVKDLVSFAKQAATSLSGLNDASTWEQLCGDFIDRYSIAVPDNQDELAIEMSREVLLKSNSVKDVVDFDDMIYFPVLHGIRSVTQYDWVLIDEAQDTNYSRRKLSLLLLKSGGRLVAVGDRHQAIYGFTGANSDALDLIRQEVKAITLPLTVTYRCPYSVVEEARRYVGHITAYEANPVGQVRHLEQKDLFSSTSAGDAILCRVNAPLVELVYKFIAKGIGAKVEGREIGTNLKTLLKKVPDFSSFRSFFHGLEVWGDKEVEKLTSKGHFVKARNLEDKLYCLNIIANRADSLNHNSGSPKEDILREIDNLFGDNLSGVVILSSIHKAKGREWKNVYYLTTPTRKNLQDWELEQERNLAYVAITRSMANLYFVEYEGK